MKKEFKTQILPVMFIDKNPWGGNLTVIDEYYSAFYGKCDEPYPYHISFRVECVLDAGSDDTGEEKDALEFRLLDEVAKALASGFGWGILKDVTVTSVKKMPKKKFTDEYNNLRENKMILALPATY